MTPRGYRPSRHEREVWRLAWAIVGIVGACGAALVGVGLWRLL